MAIHKLEKHSGYDAVSRETVNSITDANALGLWVYLMTKPDAWIPREKAIREHFGWGHDKYRKSMSWLKDAGLAEWVIYRNEIGRITGKTLHIYAETNARQNQRQAKPTASVPDPLENKDFLEKKDLLENKDGFDRFWAAYPKKVENKKCAAIWKRRKLDNLGDMIIADVTRRRIDDAQWKSGYIPNPQTYLNGDRWEDEIQTSAPKQPTKPQDISNAFMEAFGTPPPSGKSVDECWQIYRQRKGNGQEKNYSTQWWNE